MGLRHSFLRTVLAAIIRRGSLTVLLPRGRRFTVGGGQPAVTLRLHDNAAIFELARNPELAVGELYMDGRMTIEDGGIADFLNLASLNLSNRRAPAVLRAVQVARHTLRSLGRTIDARRARKNVAHHYDLSGQLYDLFLDKDRQYSCAYFSEPDMTLEEAQVAKKRHIAAKLLLDRPGLRVLDIGCGWGGMALDLAREAGAKVRGVTLSEEQLGVARGRASRAGLENSCRFDLIDYRAVEGEFDRIVSVGMFEHVGAAAYGEYFDTVAKLLTPGGVALIHTIGCPLGTDATNPFITKHIFPGGYVPALSQMTRAIEKSQLMIADVEILRIHYAETLKAWRERFEAHRAEAAALYDERFCRMWEFYLAGCEMAFRHGGLVVFQVQIIKQVDSLPITRDYMYETERHRPWAAEPLRAGARAGGASPRADFSDADRSRKPTNSSSR